MIIISLIHPFIHLTWHHHQHPFTLSFPSFSCVMCNRMGSPQDEFLAWVREMFWGEDRRKILKLNQEGSDQLLRLLNSFSSSPFRLFCMNRYSHDDRSDIEVVNHWPCVSCLRFSTSPLILSSSFPDFLYPHHQYHLVQARDSETRRGGICNG